MDKEWISNDRLSHEYEAGVESFLRFAVKSVVDPKAICCPCTSCGNLRKQSITTIGAHLYINGIDVTYHTWIWHGEHSTSAYSKNDRDQVAQS